MYWPILYILPLPNPRLAVTANHSVFDHIIRARGWYSLPPTHQELINTIHYADYIVDIPFISCVSNLLQLPRTKMMYLIPNFANFCVTDINKLLWKNPKTTTTWKWTCEMLTASGGVWWYVPFMLFSAYSHAVWGRRPRMPLLWYLMGAFGVQ